MKKTVGQDGGGSLATENEMLTNVLKLEPVAVSFALKVHMRPVPTRPR
jgi:hypothetical protein